MLIRSLTTYAPKHLGLVGSYPAIQKDPKWRSGNPPPLWARHLVPGASLIGKWILWLQPAATLTSLFSAMFGYLKALREETMSLVLREWKRMVSVSASPLTDVRRRSRELYNAHLLGPLLRFLHLCITFTHFSIFRYLHHVSACFLRRYNCRMY